MSWATGVMVYLVIWWTILFAVLPLGVRRAENPGKAERQRALRGRRLQGSGIDDPKIQRLLAILKLSQCVLPGTVHLQRLGEIAFRVRAQLDHQNAFESVGSMILQFAHGLRPAILRLLGGDDFEISRRPEGKSACFGDHRDSLNSGLPEPVLRTI